MHENALQVAAPARHRHHAVQESPALEPMVGDVLVLVREKAVARQDGVAVVAVVVHRVAAIDVLPRVAGEKRMLRLDRAASEAQGEALIQALHLLQEHEVGVERLQPLAQLVDHHAPVEVRQAFVDVEGEDPEPLKLHCSPSITMASRLDLQKLFAGAWYQGKQTKARLSCDPMRTRPSAGLRNDTIT